MILLATARPVSIIEITPEERLDLQARVKAHRAPQRHSPRATTILKRVVRMTQVDFAHDLGVSVACVVSEATRPVKPKTGRSVRSMADRPICMKSSEFLGKNCVYKFELLFRKRSVFK